MKGDDLLLEAIEEYRSDPKYIEQAFATCSRVRNASTNPTSLVTENWKQNERLRTQLVLSLRDSDPGASTGTVDAHI